MKCEFPNSFRPDLFLKIFIFIFAAVLRIVCVNDKYGMHEDEVMSFSISNYSDFWRKDYSPYQDIKGKDLKEAVFLHDTKFSSALKDVAKLWYDNRDPPHTNLYYSCLRLWMTPISSAKFEDSIKYAAWLNFIFFIFSFFIVLRILGKVQLNVAAQNCLLIAIFFNNISASAVAFIRPYALQETLLLFFSYIFIKLWNKPQIDKTKDFIIFVVTTGFTLLSGYFASIYILVLVGFFVYRRSSDRLFIISAFLCSLLFAQLLFCKFFHGFSCGRAGQSFHNFSPTTLFGNFCITLPIYEDLFCSILHWVPLLFVAAFVCWRKKIGHEIFMVSGSAFFLGVFVTFISPIKHVRYAMSFLPLINFAIFLAIKFGLDLFSKVRYTSSREFKIFYLFALAVGLINYKTDRFSFHEQRQVREILEKSPPVFVFMQSSWHVNRVLHLFSDSKNYCLVTSMEFLKQKLESENKAIIVTPYGTEIAVDELPEFESTNLCFEDSGSRNLLRIYQIFRKPLSK